MGVEGLMIFDVSIVERLVQGWLYRKCNWIVAECRETSYPKDNY